jgi:hypothetical protein
MEAMSYEKMLRGSVTASKSPHTNKVEAVNAEGATGIEPGIFRLLKYKKERFPIFSFGLQVAA